VRQSPDKLTSDIAKLQAAKPDTPGKLVLCRRLVLSSPAGWPIEDAPQGDPSPSLKAERLRHRRQGPSDETEAAALRSAAELIGAGHQSAGGRSRSIARHRPDPADPRDPRRVVVATGGCVHHHHLRGGAGSGAGGFDRSACRQLRLPDIGNIRL
jgi:hypothetical protein